MPVEVPVISTDRIDLNLLPVCLVSCAVTQNPEYALVGEAQLESFAFGFGRDKGMPRPSLINKTTSSKGGFDDQPKDRRYRQR